MPPMVNDPDATVGTDDDGPEPSTMSRGVGGATGTSAASLPNVPWVAVTRYRPGTSAAGTSRDHPSAPDRAICDGTVDVVPSASVPTGTNDTTTGRSSSAPLPSEPEMTDTPGFNIPSGTTMDGADVPAVCASTSTAAERPAGLTA
ncbi:unannotated protein [freshwater metagenome]|uniref:Unannotated protein n=1 Tax=freshwater metagenome TaxID=449393 RepID=A0A6J6HT95_9ZZZZ